MSTSQSNVISNRLPRLDLVGRHAIHVGFMCTLPQVESIAQLFQGLWNEAGDGLQDPQGEDDRVAFVSLAKYRRRSTDHVITESVSRPDEERGLAVRVTYDVNEEDGLFPPGRVPRDLDREGEVFGRLLQIRTPMRLRCHSHFIFESDDSAESVATVFVLPSTLSGETRELPFDETRGIRGVKFSSDDRQKRDYDFVLDRPSNRDVYLTINFALTSVIEATTPEEVLDRATSIAHRLVLVSRRRSPR